MNRKPNDSQLAHFMEYVEMGGGGGIEPRGDIKSMKRKEVLARAAVG